MDDSQPQEILRVAVEAMGDGPQCEILKRGIETPAFLGPFEFGGMANRVHTGGLFDDDDVIVQMSDHEAFGMRDAWQRLRMFEQHDDFVFFQATGVVGADGVADLNAARGDELADFVPGGAAEARAEHLGERVLGFGNGNGEGWEEGQVRYFRTNRRAI